MSRKKIVCGVVAATAFALLASARPFAQFGGTADQRVYFTFSGPVELPGVGLGPGKYMFHLASQTARDVVQVMSADGKKAYGMFFTKTVERTEPAPRPEVRFMEAAAGAPPPIKTYWLPGERTGKEFVYPKDQARRIAKVAKEPVLTTKAESTKAEETNTSDLVRVSSSGSESAYATAPASNISGASQAGEEAPAAPAAASTPRNEGQIARATLPRTASSTPFVGLFGLCVLALGAFVRFWRTDGV